MCGTRVRAYTEGMGIRGAVRDLLELLGVPLEAVTTGVMTTQRLLIPEPVMCGSAPAIQLQLFRRQLLRATSQGGGLGGGGRAGVAQRCDECPVCHVLIMQRGEKYSRQIENFEALRAMVVVEAAAYGCSVGVQQGEGSLLEQLQSFCNASVIVAAHGAGLFYDIGLLYLHTRSLLLACLHTGQCVGLFCLHTHILLGLFCLHTHILGLSNILVKLFYLHTRSLYGILGLFYLH